MAILIDLLLLLGFTLRVTRLIAVDEISWRYLRRPLEDRAQTARQEFWVEGLSCPFCVGFWVGVATLATLMIGGGPGDVNDAWRVVAGVFTLNYVVGHISARLD